MFLPLLYIPRQLRALAGLEHREDNQRDEGPHELRQGSVDIQDAEVDAGQLARGCNVVVATVKERGRRGARELKGVGASGVGEAAVGGGLGAAAEAVHFNAKEGKGGPGAEHPGTGGC
ncbi:hypothetical protein V493_08202 [Pseudogymnoascus sp. VKM F-4281 (FW-2241)]|nr:hypothetical protein V493_08202 [Pseudogymnoascus sp. VKM F-4281 (FW-2241)]